MYTVQVSKSPGHLISYKTILTHWQQQFSHLDALKP